MPTFKTAAPIVALAWSTALAGCLVGPNYHRPSAPTPTAYKGAEGWAPAQPSDAADRTDWWTAFGDPTLNRLEERVSVSNQTLKADEANYRQAVALVKQDRAALFPTISLTGTASDSGTFVGNNANTLTANGNRTSYTSYTVGAGGSWAPDLWGGVRRTIEGARASAQASAGTLANARLSLQVELAVDYISLRELDEEKRLLDATDEAYAKSLEITQNKYKSGVAAQSDVLTAKSQLETTQASEVDLARQRATFEDAIAMLVGVPPAELPLPPAPWTLTLPEIPAGVPSDLLQRRPDIASAERSAAAANAQIGVQTAAFYPTLSLTGTGEFSSSSLSKLFNASNALWSVGGSLAETVFDAGARSAKVAQARAAYDAAVATYRQTVLSAFQTVEDNLAAQKVLIGEENYRKSATADAVASEKILLNEYKSGTVDYTSVVTAQATALSAQTTEVALRATQLSTAVDLIAALGGGWRTSGLAARP
jgi:NodT family efflux transporter outer membrane factor (OMF) lipoprotein